MKIEPSSDGDIRVARNFDGDWMAEYYLSRRWLVEGWREAEGTFISRGDAILAARNEYGRFTFSPQWDYVSIT